MKAWIVNVLLWALVGCTLPENAPLERAAATGRQAPALVPDDVAVPDMAPGETSPETAGRSLLAENLRTAEGFIDAFYSFDPEQLRPYLTHAAESMDSILYYQGWAEGGNYRVIRRGACVPESPERFLCPITVQDDLVLALQTGFNVTDTFALTFDEVNIAAVDTSSNDQPVYYEARKWVEENLPDVMSGPCLDQWKGGTTPGDCARAMTEGYRLFHAARMARAQRESSTP